MSSDDDDEYDYDSDKCEAESLRCVMDEDASFGLKLESTNDEDSLELLRNAVKSQNVSLVQELLKQKPNLQTTTGGYVLWDAIFEDNMEIASMLVRSGANANVPKPRSTLIPVSLLVHLGCSEHQKHHELALLIIEYGAEVKRIEVDYIITYAIKWASLHFIEVLYKRAGIIHLDHLRKVAKNPRVLELIDLLIDADYIDVEEKTKRAALLLHQLHNVFSCDEERIMPAIEKLLSFGLDINKLDWSGDLKHAVIFKGNLRTVQMFVDQGMDMNKPSGDGILSLYAAATTDNYEIVKLVIKAGARINDVSVTYGGFDNPLHHEQIALHAACNKSPVNTAILNILLSHGADVNAVDVFQKTPFSYLKFSKSLNDAHRMMLKHFAILDTKGAGIHTIDKKIIENNPMMREFYGKCMGELRSMRSIKLSTNSTFFSVLILSVRMLAFLLRSQEFREKRSEYRLKESFPIFSEDMETKLEAAEKQREALADKEKALCEKLDDTLPYPALRNVIFHLYSDVTDNN